MQAVLLSGDLMVVSRVQGAGARSGTAIRALSNPSLAVETCREVQAELLLIDLAMSPVDLESIVGQLKADTSRDTRIVAFGPHVHEDRLAAAREAGCDAVMSRGQFFASVDALLAG